MDQEDEGACLLGRGKRWRKGLGKKRKQKQKRKTTKETKEQEVMKRNEIESQRKKRKKDKRKRREIRWPGKLVTEPQNIDSMPSKEFLGPALMHGIGLKVWGTCATTKCEGRYKYQVPGDSHATIARHCAASDPLALTGGFQGSSSADPPFLAASCPRETLKRRGRLGERLADMRRDSAWAGMEASLAPLIGPPRPFGLFWR